MRNINVVQMYRFEKILQAKIKINQAYLQIDL